MVALMSILEGKEEERDAVHMSTLHASKGLEFPHVFLIGVQEDTLPHKGDLDVPAEALHARIEEERRLMYVGITRAKRSLHITWHKRHKRTREYVYCEPSRFIEEMKLDKDIGSQTEEAPITPQERIASLKALLQRPSSS